MPKATWKRPGSPIGSKTKSSVQASPGQPWSGKEVKQLRSLAKANTPTGVIKMPRPRASIDSKAKREGNIAESDQSLAVQSRRRLADANVFRAGSHRGSRSRPIRRCHHGAGCTRMASRRRTGSPGSRQSRDGASNFHIPSPSQSRSGNQVSFRSYRSRAISSPRSTAARLR
jgi:hypothetical protein